MSSNVEVVKVETLKAGKTDRIVLHYKAERTKGEAWKVGGLAVKLDDASRALLKTVQPGDIVSAKIVKEGQYYNLASVSAPEQTGSNSISAGNTRNSAGKSADTNTCIQAMNALTNAIVSLGGKSTTKAIKERVIELMVVVDDVIELASSGNLKAGKLAEPAIVEALGAEEETSAEAW